MVLSPQHRSTIHTKLAPVIGDEEAAALLSHFPAREGDEPVTKDYLRAELAEFRTEIRIDVADLRTELHDQLRQATVWMVTALFGGLSIGMGLAAGIASAVN